MAKTRRNVGAHKSKYEHLCYTRAAAEALLPPVGTKMRRIPTALQSDGPYKNGNVQDCTVVAVSRQGLWFRVHYEDLGFDECIKVPDEQLQQAQHVGGARR